MTVGDIIGEPFEIHPEVVPKGGRRKRVQELLDLVGLNPEHINRYPHQFSGGQRQRIGIARGLALQPEDPRLRRAGLGARRLGAGAGHQPAGEAPGRVRPRLHLHRPRPVGRAAHLRPGRRHVPRPDRRDRRARTRSTTRPTHPYTQALLSAVPVPDPTLRGKREQIVLQGDVPSPANPPSGCRFHTRCWKAQEICSVEEPLLVLRADGRGEHPSACHFAEPRVIVETVDVSDVEPDARFTATDLRDDGLEGDDPSDLERMRDRAPHPLGRRRPRAAGGHPARRRAARRPPAAERLTVTSTRRATAAAPGPDRGPLPSRRRGISRRWPACARAAAGAGSRAGPARPGRRRRSPPRRRGRTPPRRACSLGGTARCPARGRRSAGRPASRSTWASPKDRTPGVSMTQPSSSGSAQRDGRGRGVPPATGDVVDDARGPQGEGDQGVDEGALADARVADEDADPARERLAQRVEPVGRAVVPGGDDVRDRERGVLLEERRGVGEVGLGEHEQRLHPGVVRRDEAAVDQPGAGLGVGQGRDDDELVGVGDEHPLDGVGVVGGAAQHGRSRGDAHDPGEAAVGAGRVADEVHLVADDDALAAELARPHREDDPAPRPVLDERRVAAAVDAGHPGRRRRRRARAGPCSVAASCAGSAGSGRRTRRSRASTGPSGARRDPLGQHPAPQRRELRHRLGDGADVLDDDAGHREAEHRGGHDHAVVGVGVDEPAGAAAAA